MGPNPNAENNEDGEMFPANFDQNTANTKCRLRGLFPAIKYAANKAVRESDNPFASVPHRASDIERFRSVCDNFQQFRPKNALILSKTTRWNVEKKKYAKFDDFQIAYALNQRGSDYKRIREKHKQHCDYVNAIAKSLRDNGIKTKIVQKADYTDRNIAWANVVFSAGGDGTFLLAASRIKSRKVPVIGINTDPAGSEGHLCLMNKAPVSEFDAALKRLINGDFNWLYRQRIRVTITGENVRPSPFVPKSVDDVSDFINEADLNNNTKKLLPFFNNDLGKGQILALNEVFIGEAEAARVSYYELQVDDGKYLKQKSSGLIVCTGTGSTSWHYNINKVTEQSVSDLLAIFAEKLQMQLPESERSAIIGEISDEFNRKLIFDPNSETMAYSIRDAVFNATFPAMPQRGAASCVRVRSRCSNANLVVDGGFSFEFNDGATAELEIRPDDALRTVIFR